MKKNLMNIVLVIVCGLFLYGETSANGGSEPMKTHDQILVDFNNTQELDNWRIVNDGVMGGLSSSDIEVLKTGVFVFKGLISLENNGGFASTRTLPRSFKLPGSKGLIIRVKGDGRSYQVRLHSDNQFDGISYRYIFSTKPDTWIETQVPFSLFVPVFRGRIQQHVPPVSPEKIQQIGFLIADKLAGEFRLEVDWIKAY